MGFCVIPITPPGNGISDGKRPAVDSWMTYQTRKSTIFEHKQWWPDNGTNNLGVVTGDISDIVVVDVDDEESYKKLFSVAEPKFSGTLTVKTGKGYHVYFRPSQHRRTKTFSLNDKTHHVKAIGGYVVAPPSKHSSGRTYEFSITNIPQEIDVNELDAYILQAGGIFKQSEGVSTKPLGWASELFDIVPDGERNTRAAQLCGYLIRKFQNDPAVIMGIMECWNAYYVKPPLTTGELRHLVENEYRRYKDR